MEKIRLSHPTKKIIGRIELGGSKSETNRALVLQTMYLPDLEIVNASNSMDSVAMHAALSENSGMVNIGAAGTAMRFSLAYYACNAGAEIILTGSERMQQRPIADLVDALRSLGADISYINQEGFPPLAIKGKQLIGGNVQIKGSVSSQFITALMLVAPSFTQGLEIEVTGFSVSAPYIYMTNSLMLRLGFDSRINGERIFIKPYKAPETPLKKLSIEPDWSSASYWYSFATLAKQSKVFLPFLREISMQGDSALSGLFTPLGIQSVSLGAGYSLKKIELSKTPLRLNLLGTPDLAQTMVVAAAALHIPAHFTGLKTLRVKETDRLLALKIELEKTGAKTEITEDSLTILEGIKSVESICFKTYEDHRMAMAFAPLALLGTIEIENPNVVEKSYPKFWEDLEKVGFEIAIF